MQKTGIEGVKNPDGTQGYTWNPLTGCLNHTPEGLCLGGGFPCYAFKLANGRLKSKYLANDNVAPVFLDTPGDEWQAKADPFYPRFWSERIDKARLELASARKPRGIFPVDMGELFGGWLPPEWQEEVVAVFREFPQHRFYPLTKQPQNLIKFSPFPDNCWVGVTATGYKAFNEALDYLKGIEAKVKYISVEPLLEAIPFYMERLTYCGINQIIVGAQTKPYKPPERAWLDGILEPCIKARIPVFLKNNLKPLLENDHRTFINPLYWKDGYYTSPEHPNIDLHLRQEMPK